MEDCQITVYIDTWWSYDVLDTFLACGYVHNYTIKKFIARVFTLLYEYQYTKHHGNTTFPMVLQQYLDSDYA